MRAIHAYVPYVAAALLLVSCGGDGSGGKSAADGPDRAEDGRLLSEPDPLTIEDVAAAPAGSARGAVLRVLFWGQWGNLPAIAEAYDSRVIARVGWSRVTGAYAWLRPQLATTRFKTSTTRRFGANVFVGLEFASRRSSPQRHGFVARRVGGQWRIVYDTLLDSGLRAYISSLSTDGTGRRPSARALRAGEEAAQSYRNVYPTIRRLRVGPA